MNDYFYRVRKGLLLLQSGSEILLRKKLGTLGTFQGTLKSGPYPLKTSARSMV